MPTRHRRILAAFRDDASLREALSELETHGLSAADLTQATSPAALRRWGVLPGRSAAAAHDERLERALEQGAVLLIVPVGDADAEKRISLALLRHSDGPVHVRNDIELPEEGLRQS